MLTHLNLCEISGCTTYSLAEQLESIKESFDEKNLEALDLFLQCKKVSPFTFCNFFLITNC